jgi:LysR family transcriptional regulator, hydrogen peroxide-inducible genes activator
MPPTLKQLRCLAAPSELLHFGRAAAICHVTQPALSGQIRELELRPGAPLVERRAERDGADALGRRGGAT